MRSGFVRPARRPMGWIPGGPPPAAPRHRPELWPGSGEDLCHLSGDWRILQPLRGHRWSLDDLMTAWVAASEPSRAPQRIADLGCGIGAVLLMLAWRFPSAQVVGVEAQAASAELARRSIAWNGGEGRCAVHIGDLRDSSVLAGVEPFDLITATPPYLPIGTGREPTRLLQAACHLEYRGGVEAYCATGARLLAPHASLVVCHSSGERAERAAHAAGLALVSHLEVIPRAGKAPLFSVFVLRRGPAPTAVRTALVVRDAGGRWTDAFRAVRRDMGMPDRPPRE